MTPPKAPSIHMEAIIARKAPFAVIFRRGPARRVATIGWNLADDTFTYGQVFHGVIEVGASDLSPDGRFLVYEAITYRNSYYRNCHTALSYAPYLHALDLVFHSNIELGGGFFLDNRTVYWPNGNMLERDPENRRQTNLEWSDQCDQPSESDLEFGRRYVRQMEASGWRQVRENGRTIWRKSLNRDLVLEQPRNRFPAPRYRVTDSSGATVRDGTSWFWAEFDRPRQRLVFSQDGKLFALPLSDPDGPPNLLRDFTSMAIPPVPAPYTKPKRRDRRRA